MNQPELWSAGCCTRCGASGGRDEWGTPELGWIEDEDDPRRICPDCCTADEYRDSAQAFLDAMARFAKRGAPLDQLLYDEAARIRQYIAQQEHEDAVLGAWLV